MMAKKRNTKHKGIKKTITIQDYLKANRKASREEELAQQPGWRRTTTVHKSKNDYDRKQNKNILPNEQE